MAYRRINVELIVFAEEADPVVAELNSVLDQLEGTYTLFGGGIEVAEVQHSGTRRKSALQHTVAAAGTAAGALKSASRKVAGAYRKVI
jgi:hypothetical protein